MSDTATEIELEIQRLTRSNTLTPEEHETLRLFTLMKWEEQQSRLRKIVRVSGRATVVSNTLSIEGGTAIATILLNVHAEGTSRTIECEINADLILTFFLKVGVQVAFAYDVNAAEQASVVRYMWRATPQIKVDKTTPTHQVCVRIMCGSFLR